MSLVKIVIVGIPFAVCHEVEGIFIERRAIEAPQTEAVPHEMHHHEVKDYADSLVVKNIDHLNELLRGAVAGGGGEHAADVVPPRAVEGMLGEGHEFHMGKAVFQRVIREPSGDLVVGMPASLGGGTGLAAPRAKMYLIDIQRLLKAAGAVLHPLPVGEGGRIHLHDHGGIVGSALSHLRVGIRLVADRAARLPDSVFIELSLRRAGDKD